MSQLEKISWAEFQEKTKTEWKFSYSLWGAILATAMAVLSGKCTPQDSVVFRWGVLAFSIVTILSHFFYLRWIQIRIRMARGYIYEIREEMRKCLGLSTEMPVNGQWKENPALWLQLWITILLAALLNTLVFIGK